MTNFRLDLNGVETNLAGDKTWYKDGVYHREDGPAVEMADGRKEWWYKGVFAGKGAAPDPVIWAKLTSEAHLNGCVIDFEGTKTWYKEDLLHREEGPAIEDGEYKEWWVNGELHREDGPALEFADGQTIWRLQNQNMGTGEWVFTDTYGRKEWYKNDRLHRDDGPAVVNPDGTKEWWKEGLRHREDGPAVEYADGSKCWYLNGVKHREDGPAVELFNGRKAWWKKGKRHREDGPAVVDPNEDPEWYYKDIIVGYGDSPDPVLWERVTSFEANGGPLLNGCIVDFDECKNWYKDDELHREDGPAVEPPNGFKEWYFKGLRLNKGFWDLWELLDEEQRCNPNLLKWAPF